MSAMDLDTHPNPQPNPHHRKVDLQSAHDLTYLQTNLAKSASQKLDLHFPKISRSATYIPLGGSKDNNNNNPTASQNDISDDREGDDEGEEEDPMRRRVRELVSDFLRKTWTSAGHNVSVNGIDASSLPIPHTATLSPPPPLAPARHAHSDEPHQPTPEVEGIHFKYSAFDAGLQHKLASLHGELESLTAQVSKLRRTAPAQGAEEHRSRLTAAMAADDARFERDVSGRENPEEEEGSRHGQELVIDDMRDGWNDDVKELYGRGVGELVALAGVGRSSDGQGSGRVASGGPTLTETVGKAQRARRVAMEME